MAISFQDSAHRHKLRAVWDYDLGSNGPSAEVHGAVRAAEFVSWDDGVEMRRCKHCGTGFAIHTSDRGYYYPTGRYSIKVLPPKRLDAP